jgi:superfamily II DNA or RNA helicase
VYSSYSSTLRYLQTLLQEMDVPAYLLLDDASVSERQKAIQGFIAHGGLLLGSNSLLSSGVDFRCVNSLILYDLPATKILLNHLYGRFGRGRRVKPLSIIVFDSPNLGAFNNLNVAQAVNEMAHLAG